MKYIPFFLCIAFCSCKKEFHVTVECGYNSICKCNLFTIHFTNGGLFSDREIMYLYAYDMNDNNMWTDNDVFDDENKAISFSRQFTSYDKCIKYNDSVQNRYHQFVLYQKAHPIKNEESEPLHPASCNNIKIY